MPLYEYECVACKRHTEKIQKFSDAELTICPHCGGPLERTITAAAFSFQGGGWYKDGYGSAKPAANADSGSSSASDSKDSKNSNDSNDSSAGPAKSAEAPASAAPATTTAAPSTPATTSTPKPQNPETLKP